MKLSPLVLLMLLGTCQDSQRQSAPVNLEARTTIYYLIRHAEKERGESAGNDPALTEAGKKRAANWPKHLPKIDVVYSTDTKRTKATAAPTAEKHGLKVQSYTPDNLYTEEFKKETAGKKVLIMGHSNTTPRLANTIMGTEEFTDIPDDQFGYLYMIKVVNGKATGKLRKLK